MQTTNCYFYPNEVDVQLNIDPTLKLRNRIVYQRSIKLYHGIDNTIRFTFKNNNQQRVNITGFAVTFNMVSGPEGSVIVSKPATTINAPYGVVSVVLTELELMDLPNQYYGYSLIVTDVDTGQQHIVYSDTNYDVKGELILLDGHYPSFHPSINVDLPSPVREVISSDAGYLVITTGTIVSDTPTRQQSAHHTAQFYFDHFTGIIRVQATLDSLPAVPSWATIDTLTFTDQNVPTYYNWDGVFTDCRFVIIPDQPIPGPTPTPSIPPESGKVTKILYRS